MKRTLNALFRAPMSTHRNMDAGTVSKFLLYTKGRSAFI